LGVGEFVLSVEEVPDIEASVHAGEEEKARTSFGPATVGEVGVVVTCLHDWDLQFFGPDLGAPVSHSQEVLEMDGVSVHGVDRTVMLTLLITPSTLHFGLVVSTLAHDGVSLLGTYQELVGMRILVVAQASSTVNFTIFFVVVLEDKLLERSSHVSHIPPEYAPISGSGEEFKSSPGTGVPLNIVDGVVMRLLEDRSGNGLNGATFVAFSQIVDAD